MLNVRNQHNKVPSLAVVRASFSRQVVPCCPSQLDGVYQAGSMGRKGARATVQGLGSNNRAGSRIDPAGCQEDSYEAMLGEILASAVRTSNCS